MHWISYPLAAIALYTSAALTAVQPARQPAAMLRGVARPLLLPVLWHGLEAAGRRGSPGEMLERGRLLLRILPRWIQGHMYIASRLAFEASLRETDVETALDRLEAAMLYLEQICSQQPDRSSELLIAMAFFVEARTRDPAMAAAFRARFGVDPNEHTQRLLRRAQAASPQSLETLDMRIAHHGLGMVEDCINAQDRDGALQRLDGVLEILDKIEGADATELRAGLEALKAHLQGGPKTLLAPLRGSRFRQLDNIAERLLK